MSTNARKFVLMMLGTGVAIAGGLALFNFIIDPYNRFGNNRLGVYISAEREAKATEIRRFDHDAVIIGNSRMGVIPPGKVLGFRFFNGAFAGANAEEVYWFVEHFVKKEKLVVLGIDVTMQDPPLKGDIFAPGDLGAIIGNLLNLQTVEYSFRTITQNLQRKPAFVGPDGLLDMKPWFDRVDRHDPERLQSQLAQMRRHYCNFVCPPRDQFTCYHKIADCLRRRGIPCIVVIPPMHEEVADCLQNPALKPQYDCWKAEVREIFPHLVDLSTSSYGSARNFYGADPAHFRPEAGAQMLNAEVIPVAQRLLSNRPSDVVGLGQ